MRKRNVRANQSLVINGAFRQALTNWTVFPRGSPWVQVVGQEHNGLPVRTLSVGNAASVSQDVVAPLDPGPNALYVLKFLCESRHPGTGLVRISSEGMPPLDIQIPPGRQRNEGQPLAFEPDEYEVVLDPAFRAGAMLTFSMTSPPSEPDDYNFLLYFTDIVIELHLQPLVLRAFSLDDQSHPPTAWVPLCLGAHDLGVHQLVFDVADANTWRGTAYSLAVDDNPLGAIAAEPDWPVDHPLDVPRSLSCPPLALTAPHPLTLTLINQFSADPYELKASLWHHRLQFLQVQEAGYFPVLEHNESVELGVRVASFYTREPLEGLTVTWTVAGTSIQVAAVTDAGGWAYFVFQPDVAGTFTVEASVASLFYASGVVTQNLEVRVLATDPWSQVMSVVAGEANPWALKTGWPNRGSTYPLLATVPETLVGSEISLEWKGDSQAQLKVGVSPAIKENVPVTSTRELLWTLTSADERDGNFELQLTCSKLLRPSPYKSMRLARNEIEIGAVREADKACVVDEGERATVQLEVLHRLATGQGEPVQGALAKWRLPDGSSVDSTTGAGGWASFSWQPTSAGNHTVAVQIQAHPDAIPVERTFVITAIATSPWKSHVRFFLDGVEVERNTLGLLCHRGQTHTLNVLPTPASPWIGKNISVHWRKADPVIGLSISELGAAKTLLAQGVEWTLSSPIGTSQSRPFEVELRIEGEPGVRELSGRLLHPDLREELSLLLDQVSAHLSGQAFYPCLGALHGFRALPNALTPLLGLDLFVQWTGTPAAELGATITPVLDRPQPLNADGAQWTLDFTGAVAGQFNLTLSVPQLDFVATATPMRLAHNKLRLTELRDPAIDPVIGLDKAWIRARVVSHFTDRPVADASVIWEAEGERIEVQTDADGASGFAYEPKAAGVHVVTGSVRSLFDNFEESRSTAANALAVDPWEQMFSAFDGLPVDRLGNKTYFPRRKAEHALDVSAPEGNALIGRTLTLGMSGDAPTALGVAFVPANTLGLAQVFHGALHYPFSVKDLKDGSCALRLAAERLARLSPPMHMSVGSGALVLNISAESRTDQALDWGQELVEQVRVVSGISGKPMAGWTVTWSSLELGDVTSVTDFYGVARIRFVPTVPGPAKLTARVGDQGHSASVSLAYTLNPPRAIIELVSDTPGGYPGDEVSARAMIVSPDTGEPLADVVVMWTFSDSVLASTTSNAEGVAHVTFKITDVGQGALNAVVKGGVGGWDMRTLAFDIWRPEYSPTLLTTDAPAVFVGSTLHASLKVENAPAGTTVNWSFSGLPDTQSVTDANGMATQAFVPLAIPEGSFVTLTARVGASQLSKELCVSSVDNPVYANTTVQMNNIPIFLPLQFPVPINRNKNIGIKVLVTREMVNGELAIFSNGTSVLFDPPAGTYHNVVEGFTWTMRVDDPVDTDFVAVIVAEGVVGSTGIRFKMTDEGD
ncbi:Ig-like domain-containing protein [Pseudomonas botevensis]|uniref:Ig-like domain-containing protein n=1 Tax=Pseudomonas botevensis TaxID=2842352 RepID=UPI001C3CE47E|nr:Ig-like domain-containing protein [Pseudomonas botevensis]MBV4476376.1 Ig-like domain-containing protein [Pseudomonas botevensis]